jgi:hypothetical protein
MVFVYIIWAGITYYVGKNWLGGTADVGQLRRTLGYAASPRALGILAFLPVIGSFIYGLSWVWWLVAGVVAVRQALDFSTGKAIGTVIIAFFVAAMVFMFFGFLLGIFSLAAAAPYV